MSFQNFIEVSTVFTPIGFLLGPIAFQCVDDVLIELDLDVLFDDRQCLLRCKCVAEVPFPLVLMIDLEMCAKQNG